MASVKQTLEDYQKKQMIPMHMPGHKRNPEIAPDLNHLSEQLDVTEIDGLDNLHQAEGMLKTAMERAAGVWKSDESYFLVNGSTCGILAGIRTLTRRGDKVLVTRNSHKSVFHAMELCGLEPVFLLPPFLSEAGMFGSVSPQQVSQALEQNKDIQLVVITSPTYEGVISDLREICNIAHNHHIPVLVDEAHGAHLDLFDVFPGGAVGAGADLTVHSLHKTLPSLTQTALLHVKGSRVDRGRLRHQLAVFETSSPSYLLLSSIDSCIRSLDHKKLADWLNCLTAFYQQTTALKQLTILRKQTGMFGFDLGKILILVNGTNLTGEQLSKELQQRGIEPEMVAPNFVLAMTGLGDTPNTMKALATALLDIDQICSPAPVIATPSPEIPVRAKQPEEALEQEFLLLPLEQAVGRVSAEYLWAYPPGVPLVIPGEQIPILSPHRTLFSTRGKFPQTIAVLRES